MIDFLSQALHSMPITTKVADQSGLFTREQRLQDKLDYEREQYLTDPMKAERLVSHLVRGNVPVKVLEKGKLGRDATLERLDKAIPDDDPRKGIGGKILSDALTAIEVDPTRRPIEHIRNAYVQNMEAVRPATYQYLDKAQSNFLGIPFTGKELGRDVADMPGYSSYRSEIDKKKAGERFDLGEFTSPVTGAMFAAGQEVGGKVLEKVGENLVGRGMNGFLPRALQSFGKGAQVMNKIPGGPVAKIAGMVGMGIAEMWAMDAAQQLIERSDWGKENPMLGKIAGFAASIPAASVARMPIERGIKAIYASRNAVKSIADNPAAETIVKEADSLINAPDMAKPENVVAKTAVDMADQTGAKATDLTYDAIKEAKLAEAMKAKAYGNIRGGLTRNGLHFDKQEFAIYDAGVKNGIDPDQLMQDLIDHRAKVGFQDNIAQANGAPKAVDNLQSTPSGLTDSEIGQLFKSRFTEPKKGVLSEDKLYDISGLKIESESPKIVSDLVTPTTPEVKIPEPNKIPSLYKNLGGLHPESSVDDIMKAIEDPDVAANFRKMFDNEGWKPPEAFRTVYTRTDPTKYSDIVLKDLKASGEQIEKEMAGEVVPEVGSSKKFVLKTNADTDTADVIDQVVEHAEKYGLSTEAEDALTKKAINEYNKRVKNGTLGSMIIPAAITSSILVPLATLVPGGEGTAEASTLGTVTKFTEEVGKSVWKDWRDIIKNLGERNLVMTPYKVGSKDLGELAQSIKIAPSLEDVTRRERLPLQEQMSLGTIGELIFGGSTKGGRKQPTNIADQVLSTQATAAHNRSKFSSFVEDVLRYVDGINDGSAEIREATAKFVGTKEDPGLAQMNMKFNTAEGRVRELQRQEDAFMARAKKATGTDFDELIDSATKIGLEKQRAQAIADELKPFAEQYSQGLSQVQRELAAKYPRARIALALDGVGMKEGDQWLLPLLQPKEIEAVGLLRKGFDKIGQRIKEVGGDLIESGPYLHHPLHPDMNTKDLIKYMSDLNPNDPQALMPLAKIYSRGFNSQLSIPDIKYITDMYGSDIFKRIEWMDFWKKGQKGGWAEFKKNAEFHNMPGVVSMLQSIERGLMPSPDTWGNEAARKFYALEAIRLIGLNPAPGFKHLMKLVQNIANFGPVEWLKTVPEAFNLHRRALAADMLEKVTGRPVQRDEITEAYRAMTGAGDIMRITRDLEDAVPKGVFEKWTDKVADIGGSIINFTERFDRAVSFVGALKMAQKTGMTAEQAAYGVYDTILKTNFMSGVQNPSWLQNPKVRMLFMFQGTPFKIMEQRVLQAMRGGKDISEGTKELFKGLMELKNDIKEGEEIFKKGTFQDAMEAATKHKDIYGIPYSKQLMRNIMATGTILTGGATLFDADLKGHLLHTPLISAEEGKYKVAFNPMINAAVEAKKSEDDDFWVSGFLRKWMGSGPIPQTVLKGMRLSNGDIPERYRGSPFRYVFGVPATKDE